VQGDFNTQFMQGDQPVKFIYRSAIIRGKRDMNGNNMQVSHRGKNSLVIWITGKSPKKFFGLFNSFQLRSISF
jgi:hypothetical protein